MYDHIEAILFILHPRTLEPALSGDQHYSRLAAVCRLTLYVNTFWTSCGTDIIHITLMGINTGSQNITS